MHAARRRAASRAVSRGEDARAPHRPRRGLPARLSGVLRRLRSGGGVGRGRLLERARHHLRVDRVLRAGVHARRISLHATGRTRGGRVRPPLRTLLRSLPRRRLRRCWPGRRAGHGVRRPGGVPCGQPDRRGMRETARVPRRTLGRGLGRPRPGGRRSRATRHLLRLAVGRVRRPLMPRIGLGLLDLLSVASSATRESPSVRKGGGLVGATRANRPFESSSRRRRGPSAQERQYVASRDPTGLQPSGRTPWLLSALKTPRLSTTDRHTATRTPKVTSR